MIHYLIRSLTTTLIGQIILALILGTILALLLPEVALLFTPLGTLFVSALKAVAPVLIFIIVMHAIANRQHRSLAPMRSIIGMYFLSTLTATFVALVLSLLFKPEITTLLNVQSEFVNTPKNVSDVFQSLLGRVVENPILAISNANYIGILVWSVALGWLFYQSAPSSKQLLADMSDALSKIIRFVIKLAPIGIFGLITHTVANFGIHALANYAELLAVLLGAMLIVFFVVNPVLAFLYHRKNPYPLLFTCLKESGIPAFFTRSSAANIPINIVLCKKLGIDHTIYSISIPLGATINMAGAAVTITVLTLATVHTLNIDIDVASAFILCFVGVLAACGSSGIAGGSLLLIPVACSLFGIPDTIALQVVAVGFVISILQDSTETAVNSSTDVLFTATSARAS